MVLVTHSSLLATTSARMMGAPDSRGRRLLFPRALPRLAPLASLAPGPSQDHEKKRKIAVKCLELEEMLEKQG